MKLEAVSILSDASRHHLLDINFSYFYIRARIDNNRREYCERKLRKDGVHACVLRIFFRFALLLSSFCKLLRSLTNVRALSIPKSTAKYFVFGMDFFFLLCENRQQLT